MCWHLFDFGRTPGSNYGKPMQNSSQYGNFGYRTFFTCLRAGGNAALFWKTPAEQASPDSIPEGWGQKSVFRAQCGKCGRRKPACRNSTIGLLGELIKDLASNGSFFQ